MVASVHLHDESCEHEIVHMTTMDPGSSVFPLVFGHAMTVASYLSVAQVPCHKSQGSETDRDVDRLERLDPTERRTNEGGLRVRVVPGQKKHTDCCGDEDGDSLSGVG